MVQERARGPTQGRLNQAEGPAGESGAPSEPQAGPLLLKADVHPITGFDESESALSPKRGRTESIAPPERSERGFLRHASGLNTVRPHFTSA
jgi:hypothetical protein